MSVCGSRNWVGCRSLSRPLTILGCERRVFILAATFGAVVFNALGSLVAGLLLFGVGYAAGRFGTQADPHMLGVMRAAAQEKARYDPAKRPASEGDVEIVAVEQGESR